MSGTVNSRQSKISALSSDRLKFLEQRLRQKRTSLHAIPRCPRDGCREPQRFVASWAQERLWFIDQLDEGGPAYNLPIVIVLHGTLDERALRAALRALVQRHEILRTVLVNKDRQLWQEIAPQGSFELETFDVRGTHCEQQIGSHKLQEARSRFDLQSGPLFRGRLLRTSAAEHLLLLTVHHIAADGWSIELIFRELAQLYEASHKGTKDPLQPLPIQYADYAEWQRETLRGKVLQEQLDYWRQRLAGAEQQLTLPTDHTRPPSPSYQGLSVDIALDIELTTALYGLAQRHRVTHFMMLYGAWAILLARLSGQEDIVIGTPVANRQRPEVEGLIGLLVNTVVLRVAVEGETPMPKFLQCVKEAVLAAFDHQDLPFEQLVEAVRPQRSLNRHPIFQVMFVLQNVRRESQWSDMSAALEDGPNESAKFDLLLSLEERAGCIVGTLNGDAALFERGTLERWAASFLCLLRGIAQGGDGCIADLPILPADQQHQLLECFNASRLEYPKNQLIHELFEQQVRRSGEAIALVYEGHALTYHQLDARANQLARYLRAKGAGPERLVGVSAGRSLHPIVACMGILKSGAAYVPLDPSYPAELLRYMVKDAQPTVTLVEEKRTSVLAVEATELVALVDDWEVIASYSASDPNAVDEPRRPDRLAYVIYTSGSTGRPKGVMIEHSGVINLWRGLEQVYEQCGGCQRVALNASLNFDASVQQLVQLLSGRTLFIVPQAARRDASMLLDFIAEQKIEAIDCTPSQLKAWIAVGLLDRPTSLRLVLVGGEAIDIELWSRLAQSSTVAFYNVYGPTECTVDVTVAPMRGDRSAPHVGRPMLNRRVYILDRHQRPVPVAVTGEIYAGGQGIARAYLNQPELTTQRFMRDPFSADPEARTYRTGDLGRWRADGSIEYLGRNDNQVKVRGFRIELGEIEAQLLRCSSVTDAVVVAREEAPGEKRLVAYVVPTPGSDDPPLIAETLRAHLKALLPDHMVPSAFVVLQRLPLTSSGKLDRNALPAPQLDAYVRRQYEPPQGEAEELLAGIWQALLKVERVGRQDNFFELGGHSLLIVEMLARLRHFGLVTAVRSVFERANLQQLASCLTRGGAGEFATLPNLIPPECDRITPQMLNLVELSQHQLDRLVQQVAGGAANIKDIYPLTPLQEGILFHHLLSGSTGDTYVVATLLKVSSRARLNDLIAALQQVIDRHDMLRTSMHWEHLPSPVQVVLRHATLPVEELVLDVRGDRKEYVAHWMKPEHQQLDLTQAPLMRMRIAPDNASAEWYALLQMHHIVGDNTSREIVISEVVACLEGRDEQLPVPVAYRNHAAQALAYRRTSDDEAFFRSKLSDVTEATAPFGLMDVHGDGSELRSARGQIDSALTKRVRAQARRFGVSSAALFHAAWALVVAHASGRNDVVFGTVLSGRLQGGIESQHTFGMLINTLPLRLRLGDLSAKQLVERAQKEVAELLVHEQASLALAQRCSGITGSAALFSALLNYRRSVPDREAQWSDATGINFIAVKDRTNYPIVASIDDREEAFGLSAQVSPPIDPQRIIEYLGNASRALIDALEAGSSKPVLMLVIMPDRERRQAVELFNVTRAPFPRDRLLHELFEEQVERRPDAPAVLFDSYVLSYAELNARANRLAHYLRGNGLTVGEFVPVQMTRSFDMLIAQIAVLKCGGVYVPIDPELPRDRRAFMIRDCAARRVLIAGTKFEEELGLSGIPCINCTSSAIAALPSENLRTRLESTRSAYVMYTSGSTGVPKGVIVPHYAVTRLVINNGFACIEPADCIAHYSNPAFDAATLEVWGALLTGARMLVVPQAVVLDPSRFAELLEERSVSLLYMSVGLFNQYADTLARVFAQLRYLMVGGEALDPVAAGKVLRNSPPQHLLNVYGPTECTTFSTTYEITAAVEGPDRLPIGRPMSNAQIYVLDERRQLAPIGAIGEIHIGGAGVASGYLNRPELTAERFVADCFTAEAGARMYKTGDVGRWRDDGILEFFGRNDQQVKIRGFRIELGEIETRLTRHSDVKETVVLAREDVAGDKRLVAYIVARDNANPPTIESLREYLQGVLPQYMVPSAFVLTQKIPLSSTGKVDRRALPAPEHDAYGTGTYEAPRGLREDELARIYEQVLKREHVGRNDSFFDLGGHSLLALQALVRIQESLGVSLRITDLYQRPTINELAQHIQTGARNDEFVNLVVEAQLDDDITRLPGVCTSPARNVLLTGATGFVGRFLLVQLLKDTNANVHCLVRGVTPGEALARLRTTLSRWNLWRDQFADRVVAVPGDLRLPGLGIDAEHYSWLSENIDEIFHCGTSMNHLETYAMARAANVQSARELLRLATAHKPKLVNYISTLGVFSYATSEAPRLVDETTSIEKERHSIASGYVASKWVAEKMFMTAADRGIPCNIFRLGLVWADTDHGRYDERQHVFRLIKSCLLSGFGIRDYRNEMAPTPVDYVSRSIVFLAGRHREGRGIFHIAASEQMSQGWFERCNEIANARLTLLPYFEWIREIRRLHLQGHLLPIVPLIEFAFSLDEKSLEHSNSRARALRFEATRTHRELDQGSIVAPMLDDRLLSITLESLIAGDTQLQELACARRMESCIDTGPSMETPNACAAASIRLANIDYEPDWG